jgi:Arc/MetJ-type ribon-helix-helix transcriptional regulator
MATPKGESINVRLPAALKAAVKTIADSRFTSESEIAREAIVEYLKVRGVALQPAEAALLSSAPVQQTDTSDPVVDMVKRHHPKGRGSVRPKSHK